MVLKDEQPYTNRPNAQTRSIFVKDNAVKTETITHKKASAENETGAPLANLSHTQMKNSILLIGLVLMVLFGGWLHVLGKGLKVAQKDIVTR